MKRSYLVPTAAALGALTFLGAGAALWFAPAETAARLGLSPDGAAGLTAIRADLGGLFIGLAILCGAALFSRRKSFYLAAASMLGAVAAGRLFSWMTHGGTPGGPLALGVELGLGGAFVIGALDRSEHAAPRAPRRISRWLKIGGAIVGVALIALLIVFNSTTAMQAIYDRGARKMTARVNTAPLADDALRVVVFGSSAPLPSARRAKASVGVFAGGKFYLVDAGPESTENIVLSGIPLSQVGAVLLTHFHSDHIGDLGELQLQTWAGGRKAPLQVYGGPGVDRVVAGFNDAYRMDQGYRTEHHGEQVMPSATWGLVARTVVLDGAPTPAKSRTAIVMDDGELRITAIEVDHAPIEPAYAYRFDYKGRSVVVSGDLKYHPPLAAGSRGADLLVSEAIALNLTRSLGSAATSAGRTGTAAIMHDIEDYHITPEQAAQTANDANVRLLVYYHLLPAADDPLSRRLFAAGVKRVRRSGWTIAEDLSMYTLPLGSTEIRIGKVND